MRMTQLRALVGYVGKPQRRTKSKSALAGGGKRRVYGDSLTNFGRRSPRQSQRRHEIMGKRKTVRELRGGPWEGQLSGRPVLVARVAGKQA